jgi:hypothetical protein
MNIQVEARHISSGTRRDPARNPVALAIVAALPSGHHAYVTAESLTVGELRDLAGHSWTGMSTPTAPTVAAFVSTFDAAGAVLPMAFDLDFTARAGT